MSKDTTPTRRNTSTQHSGKSSERCSCSGDGPHSKYKATALWNNIVRRFREELPVKRHRRQLTYFEDSFTGKEAVDFLMVLLPRLLFEGRQVDRSNCVTLLQKFLDQGFIRKIRSNPDVKDIFKDNATLYVFVDDCALLGTTRTPRLVRTSSCNEDRHRIVNSAARLRSTHQRKSPDQFQFLKIETPASNRGFDRRMSSSHGNLLSLLPTHSQLTHKESDSADSLAETIDSRIVEVNFSLRPSPLKRNNTPKAFRTGFKDEESATKISQTELESSSKAVSTQNITHVASSLAKENEVAGKESAYEWLTLVRRKMTQNNKLPLSQRSSNPYKQVEKSEKLGEHRKRTGDGMVKSELSELEYAPLKVTHRRITEIDSWLVWKNCLLARLRRTLAVTHLPFITWEVLGQDVKWNCQRVGVSGIVKLRSDRDDFSSYLMRLMRYLEQFPFPSGSANIITYKDNQEVNVFRTVCSHLTREQPILTNAQASALLYVISLHNAVRSDLPHQRYGWPVHIETEFTENAPRSRIVPRQSSSGNSTTSTTDSTPSFTESLERFSFNRGDRLLENTGVGLQPSHVNTSRHAESLVPLGTIAEPSRLGHERGNAFILGVPKYNEVLNLPGLKESPELLQRLNEMCLKLQPNSDLIGQVSSEFMRLPEFNQFVFADHQFGISHLSRMSSHTSSLTSATTNSFSEELLLRPPDHILEALSLLLLSLPSPRRRRLHYLIRFMNKISANHCLQLDDVHSNRYAVLKGLSGSIVSTQGASPLSTSQCSHLVSLLLDYEKEIFSVPKGLILEVDAAIRERQREKVTPVGQSPGLRSEMADYVQFCEPAKGSEYEEQNLNLVDNLLELLDQICIDENLTVQEKRKRLKKFKKTYPSVYSRRFPSPELSIPKKKERENRFLFKLFSR